jgi:ABC-type multidrug transport system ATPase subunit
VGRIFHSTLGSGDLGDEAFPARCPLCDEFDGCRALYLDAYDHMQRHANATTCTRPNLAANVTEAAKADTFLVLFVREQMLSSCNVSARHAATGTTHTNYYARLRQRDFRDSLGSGAYCESRTLPAGGGQDAERVRDDAVQSRGDCEEFHGVCGVYDQSVSGYLVADAGTPRTVCEQQSNYRWFGAEWKTDEARINVDGRLWDGVSDRTQCELTIAPCDPGLLCIRDQHPVPCPAGYYCPEFGGTKVLCPAGSFCPESSARPIPCTALGTCPAGSSVQQQPLLLVLCIVLAVGISLGVFFLQRMRKQRMDAAARQSVHGRTNDALGEGIELAAVEGKTGGTGGAAAATATAAAAATLPIKERIQISFNHLELVMPGDCTSCSLSFCRCCCCCRNGIHPSTRLAGTSGQIMPGELTCIMGASGAGKSTFLNIIAGKLNPSGGDMSINGKRGSLTHYKGRIGYVPQSDIMHATATVREIVTHSAMTRLPATATATGPKVDAVLALLGLAHVADSVVGDDHSRGISGGEKKRVNIAMEMVADPVALLLDEPTSGLDATTAEDVMRALQKIAASGVTVVAVIHQPRVEIYELIDKLLLLGRGGKTVYLGPAADAAAYFQTLGYVPEPDDNFADFALDVLSGSVLHRDPAGAVGPSEKSRGGAASAEQTDAQAAALSQAWSDAQKKQEGKTASGSNDATNDTHGSIRPTPGSRAGFCQQFCAFLARGARLRYFRTYGLVVDLMAFLLDGFIIAMIFGNKPLLIPARGMQYMENCPKGAEHKCYSPVRNQIGPFGFYMTMALGIVAASVSTKSFCGPEKVIFWREAGTGVSVAAYFLSVLVIDIPVQLLGALFFVAPVAMFTQFRGPMDMYLLWSICLVWCVFGMGNLIGTAFETDLALSTLLATMVAVLANLFGGYVPKAGTGGYYAYTRYSARALSYIEMALGYPSDFPTTIDPKCLAEGGEQLWDQDGCFRDWDSCENNGGGGPDSDTSACLISKYDRYVVDEHMGPTLAVDLVMLVVFGVVLRAAAFFALGHVRRDKMR